MRYTRFFCSRGQNCPSFIFPCFTGVVYLFPAYTKDKNFLVLYSHTFPGYSIPFSGAGSGLNFSVLFFGKFRFCRIQISYGAALYQRAGEDYSLRRLAFDEVAKLKEGRFAEFYKILTDRGKIVIGVS